MSDHEHRRHATSLHPALRPSWLVSDRPFWLAWVPNPAQVARVTAAKQVVYEGFKVALAHGVPQDRAGLLVDEQFGRAILADAQLNGFTTCAPVEKSGQDEFDFDYGADFAKHIEIVKPTFCKALVRYNPGGDAALNARQTDRLRFLSKYLHEQRGLFMFELLVPPEPEQLTSVGGKMSSFDHELRPNLMVEAIRTLQDAGVEPDVWKIEGLDTLTDWNQVVAAVQRNGREHVGTIVLGRGESEEKVIEWLRIAAAVPGCKGFAVGRTSFWQALTDWRDGRLSPSEAASQIADRYASWVSTFEQARSEVAA